MINTGSAQLFFAQPVLITVLIFTLIPLLIGSAAFQNSVSTIGDFFICNRGMGPFVSFFTVYATWWSSFAFLGSVTYFYRLGPVYWTGIAWNILFGILYMIYGSRIAACGRAYQYITPLDFFRGIYGSRLLNGMIGAVMVAATAIYFQIQLFGGAIIISMALNQMVSWQICALIFYVVMIIYIWSGGMRAIAWADVFYGMLIFCGMLFSGFYLASRADGVFPLFSEMRSVSPEMLILPGAGAGSPYSGSAMWLAMFILLPLGALMGPQMWLRMTATGQRKTFSVMPLLISGAAIAYLGSMVAGNLAIRELPSGAAAGTDYILPALLSLLSEPWISALVLCCGAAACLSTANSEIHAISSILTLNVYRRFFSPGATEKRTVFFAKIMIVVFSSGAYIVLVALNNVRSIVDTGILSLSVTAQIIVPLTGALFWAGSRAEGAAAGMLAGILTVLLPFFMERLSFPLHPGMAGLLVNAAVFFLVSLLLGKSPETASAVRAHREKCASFF